MARHILKLRYDGLLAARNELAPSASKQVVQGAQMFLGAHAHYYLSGIVPERINDKGPGYEITDLARRAGSWRADFAVSLCADGMWEAMKLDFGLFVYESYRAWAEGRVYEDPPFETSEPYAGSYDGSRQHQRLRLSKRVGQSIALITAPNGTSASVLEMSIDSFVFAVIEHRIPVYSEEDVTEAVSRFRETFKAVRGGRLN
jgi:hypothetical protein